MDVFNRKNRIVTALSAMFVCLSLQSPAMASQEDQSQGSNDAQEEVEVVEVRGRKPLLFYRKEMERAELGFYDELNDLMTEPKYKMRCERERKEETVRIKVTVCLPQYFRDKMAQMTQDARDAGWPAPTPDDVAATLKKEQEEALQYTAMLIEQNPALKASLIKMHQAKQTFEQKSLQFEQ